MRFQVPQFIDVEDKIFGPLTLKQFIYLAGGGGLSFLLYILLGSFILSAIPILIVIAISCALAFYKMNSKPFIYLVEAAFKYWTGAKLYIWKKEEGAKPKTMAEEVKRGQNFAGMTVPKISESKLKDLSWSLDIKERGAESGTQ